jgi:lipid II:glycine glycyltransferase (peptidoglycan interpeptide bridge formation enzyme)
LRKELLGAAVEQAIIYGKKTGWKYIEWRDTDYFHKETPPWEVYYTHDLNLKRTESELFSSLKDSNRRNISKANKEGVSIKIDCSLATLKSFYRLNCLTRKRHGLPPQPFFFFKKVFDSVISKGYGIVVTAFHSNTIIASSVFFHFGMKAIFKYGASNMKYQNLRPNNLIIWEAIKWYRNHGHDTLNFGRTKFDNHGLLRFKRLWGAIESPLKYYRYNCKKEAHIQNQHRMDLQIKLFSRTPVSILRILGRLLYKHIG